MYMSLRPLSVAAEPEYVGFETYRLAVRYVVYGAYVDTFVVVIAFAERFRVAAVALFMNTDSE